MRVELAWVGLGGRGRVLDVGLGLLGWGVRLGLGSGLGLGVGFGLGSGSLPSSSASSGAKGSGEEAARRAALHGAPSTSSRSAAATCAPTVPLPCYAACATYGTARRRLVRAHRVRSERVGPGGRLPCASGANSTPQAGTRSPYAQCRRPGAHVCSLGSDHGGGARVTVGHVRTQRSQHVSGGDEARATGERHGEVAQQRGGDAYALEIRA